MIQFFEEQDTNSKPPESQGEKSPEDENPGPGREKIKWDGSQAELVSDDSAFAFEEQHTGIKLKYTLTSTEIFKALLKTQYTFSRKFSSAFAVLLSAVMAVFFIMKMNSTGNTRFASLAAVCIMVVITVMFVPSIVIKIHSLKIADGREIHMKIYPDHIQMKVSNTKWKIQLDGSSESIRVGNLIVIYIKQQNFVILPLRCVEPAVLPEVQAMIVSGTKHRI